MKLNIKTANLDPSGPMAVSSANRDVYYPEFTITQNESDEVTDLGDAPEEGVMTIRYCIARSSENNKTGQCTYTVEVRELIDAKGEKPEAPSRKYDDAASSLDRLRDEKIKEESAEGY